MAGGRCTPRAPSGGAAAREALDPKNTRSDQVIDGGIDNITWQAGALGDVRPQVSAVLHGFTYLGERTVSQGESRTEKWLLRAARPR